LIDWLEKIDTELFLWLNGKHASWLDHVMYLVSHKFFWIPLYLILLVVLINKYDKKIKPLAIAILLIFLTAASSDQVARAIKYSVKRYRPCHNLAICDKVHNPEKGSGKYGFVSSHAANTFGMAFIFSLLIRNRKWSILLFFWASLVAYSRIYNGVHYPSDIIAGATVGMAIAGLLYMIANKITPLRNINSLRHE
jgi:undecaprenyl-diphosphatase